MIPHQLIPRLAAALLLALAATLTAHASISCSAQFSDHMVLQQGRPVPIWGWATPGANVAVAFAGQNQQTRADADGSWHVTLDPLAISAENRSVTISSGSEKLVFENVLVGEVWLASGQSNMEWALKKFRDKGAAMPDVDRSLIRIMTVEQTVSNTPQDRLEGEWVSLASESWLDLSATASYFAAYLVEELKIPVGVIQSSWGGALIEPWMPDESFADLESGKNGLRLGLTQEQIEEVAQRPWNLKSPSVMYNSMIHPCAGMAIRGAIWYQGESNVGDTWYEERMAALIHSWRKVWGIGDFPFYLVQLAPHNRYGGEQLGRMWEMQLNTARNVPNTGMAVIADSAQPKNIHPDNKPHVGKRLALWALAKDYNKPVVYSGPWFKGFKAIGNRIEIEFDHADSGLAFEGKKINAVRILGEGDEAYVEATPTIQGRKLIVEHPEGKKALHVRMGWTKEDVINLTNKEGLPASPFRTDRD